MRKIALIGVTGKNWWTDPDKVKFVKIHTPDGYELLNYHARYGTHSMESHADEAYNSPFILEQVVKADRDGVDAIMIDCAGDPILNAAREVTSTPVIGVRQAALHFALTLGSKFSIITVQGESLVRLMESGVRKEGLEMFCASVRYLKMPVLELEGSPEKAQKELLEMTKQVLDDGADVVVLGCTGLSHKIDLDEITRITGVPIIDPFIIGVWSAVTMIESGLSHSKIAYPFPPKKPIVEIPSLKGFLDDILRE